MVSIDDGGGWVKVIFFRVIWLKGIVSDVIWFKGTVSDVIWLKGRVSEVFLWHRLKLAETFSIIINRKYYETLRRARRFNNKKQTYYLKIDISTNRNQKRNM
jgi:hypothetical protein